MSSLEKQIESSKTLSGNLTNSIRGKKDEEVSSFLEGIGLGIDSTTANNTAMSRSLITNSSRGIFGMPHQFLASTDKRVSGGNNGFGRKYAEKIVSAMPVVLFTPGKPKFMKGFKKSDRSNILKALANKAENTLNELINSKENGKFYSFEFEYAKYYDVVNSMCRKLAYLMDVQDETLDGTKLGSYNWANYTNDSFKNFLTSKECVAFYVDAENQVQDSFSNDTSASMLASSVNGMSDTARELQFLLGSGGAQFDALRSENASATLDSLNSWASKYSSILPDGLMAKLTEGVVTVSTGGKMFFPEIWNDSSYSPSYDISMKFRANSGDKLSIYLEIMVPLLHILGMTVPMQLGANGYQSPFLVRIYGQGLYNINMGIISSVSVSRGGNSAFTADHLPTQIDVSINVKDLYNVLALTQSTKIIDNINNTAMLDYLANLAGININKVDMGRSIDIFFSSVTNGVIDSLVRNRFTSVQQTISNIANSLYNKR